MRRELVQNYTQVERVVDSRTILGEYDAAMWDWKVIMSPPS